MELVTRRVPRAHRGRSNHRRPARRRPTAGRAVRPARRRPARARWTSGRLLVAARTDPALARVRDRTTGRCTRVSSASSARCTTPACSRGHIGWSGSGAVARPGRRHRSPLARQPTPRMDAERLHAVLDATSRPCSWMGTPCSRTPSPRTARMDPWFTSSTSQTPPTPGWANRDLNSSDRAPTARRQGHGDRRGRWWCSGCSHRDFTPNSLLGVDRRLTELSADLEGVDVPFYRSTADVMAQVVGFHLKPRCPRGRAPPPALDARTSCATPAPSRCSRASTTTENIGSMFRNGRRSRCRRNLFGAAVADPLYRRAVRVSMGHALRVPFAQTPEWPRARTEHAARQRFQLISLSESVGADARGGDEGERVALLLGAEGPD